MVQDGGKKKKNKNKNKKKQQQQNESEIEHQEPATATAPAPPPAEPKNQHGGGISSKSYPTQCAEGGFKHSKFLWLKRFRLG